MVGFLAAALDYRPFFTEDEVVTHVAQVIARPSSAREARLSEEGYRQPPGVLRSLMIYEAELKRLWLIADDRKLYVVSDDRGWEDLSIATSMAISLARPVVICDLPKPTVRFGSTGGAWSLSRKLFQRVSMKGLIEGFLSETKN